MNRKLLVLLALSVVAAILAYGVARSDFDWALFFSSLGNLQAGWLGISIALTLLTYLFRAFRWQTLLAPLKEIHVIPLFWTTVVGFAAIYLLGRAGELARPLWLSRREKVSFSASIATILVERFLDALMLIVTFAVALVIIEVPPESAEMLARLKNAGWFIAATAVAAMVMLFVLRSSSEAVVRLVKHIRLPRIADLVENFLRGLGFLSNGRSLAIVMLHSAALWFVISVQFWCMLFGMNIDFSFGASTLVLVAAAIGSVVSVPGIGGGFQLAFGACMTTFFKMPKEQAVAAALLAYVFSYLPTIVAGGVYMLTQGMSMRELKAGMRSAESETL